jgi:hypothetical protein
MYDSGIAARLDSYVLTFSSVTFNILYGGTGSTNYLFTQDLTGTTTGTDYVTGTTFMSAGDWLSMDIKTVNGTPGMVTATLTVT